MNLIYGQSFLRKKYNFNTFFMRPCQILMHLNLTYLIVVKQNQKFYFDYIEKLYLNQRNICFYQNPFKRLLSATFVKTELSTNSNIC